MAVQQLNLFRTFPTVPEKTKANIRSNPTARIYLADLSHSAGGGLWSTWMSTPRRTTGGFTGPTQPAFQVDMLTLLGNLNDVCYWSKRGFTHAFRGHNRSCSQGPGDGGIQSSESKQRRDFGRC